MNNKNQGPQSNASKMTDMEVANEIGQLKTKVSEMEQAVASVKNQSQQPGQAQQAQQPQQQVQQAQKANQQPQG